MKITDEMVEAACRAYAEHDIPDLPRCVRLMLEAALAAAPEPAWVEELTAEWERESAKLISQHGGGAGHGMLRCAAELRARARGAT